MAPLVDTHTHIYGKQFASDRPEVIARAQAEGVEKFYLPGIDSTVIDDMLALEAQYPGICIPMMGLHPTSVDAGYQAELDIIETWLNRRPFPAIGEIGLDFYWDRTHEAQQYEAFRAQIELALVYKLPIVIHTRNAMPETIRVVREYTPRGLRGIFHCFGDTYESACAIIDAGFALGIGGVLTYKNSTLPAVLQRIPLEHIVLETDAPYLTPVPFRGKRNEPAYLRYVVDHLATIKGVPAATIASVTTANAQKIFTP
ncbi:TatD family hydrolase [Dinghuibacter silviterrae]|uniref:TatD DNase family protein n=1 Tax=Dinghuibacter silviterrae TaxID=1539049 RepID=A0A4R8DMZ1_9BACT|nr:TatD family hydrolase [Dinghuibacter silviterrae]TDW99363.1 TatD DNase family protein [Dinghuibacter silviterrae]